MPEEPTFLRVTKLGGSLLDEADLRTRLRDWFARQSRATNVMLVGGGRFVDVLRDADHRQSLGDETCHWLAIRVMSLTVRLVHAMLPEFRLVSRLEDLEPGPDNVALLDPWDFLQGEESSEMASLPHSWDVTSDSIAAHLAAHTGAKELVLLKSSLPTVGTVAEAACRGYVDRYFPKAAAGLRVRCVDLRDEEFAERTLE